MMVDNTSLNNVAAPIGFPRSSGATEVREKPAETNSRPVTKELIEPPGISVAQVAAEVKEDKLRSIGALRSVTESIQEAVEVLNEALSKKLTSASIRRDEDLNRYLVTIKDKSSGEVVREIPAEALLKFARNLEELKGILFDETL